MRLDPLPALCLGCLAVVPSDVSTHHGTLHRYTVMSDTAPFAHAATAEKYRAECIWQNTVTPTACFPVSLCNTQCGHASLVPHRVTRRSLASPSADSTVHICAPN